MTDQTGTPPFHFRLRDDLHTLPEPLAEQEINLHTSFAVAEKAIYYSLPPVGLVRMSVDMRQHEIVPMDAALQAMNFHSVRIGQMNGKPRLILTANEDERVIVADMAGAVDFVVPRPQLPPYKSEEAVYKPTDEVLVDERLYIADGYGENYISVFDVRSQAWVDIFGGQTEDRTENGKFRTAHSISRTPDGEQLIIADRWNSRVQIHDFDGAFVASHAFPYNAWLCNIDFVEWDGRWLGVIPCLYDVDEEKKNPAPIYVVDGTTFEILATLRPKAELGIERAQRIHAANWHIHDGRLYIIAHSWNLGRYFVLEHIH